MPTPARWSVAAGAVVLAASACTGSTTPTSTARSGSASAGVTTSPTRGQDPSGAATGWIAFQSNAFRIHLVRPDGADEHALDAVTTGPEDNPDWSPDGTRLTFVGAGSDTDGRVGLWVINVDGSGLTKVVDCAAPCQYLDDPAWSPDGSTIIYSRMQPDATSGGRLETVELASGRTSVVRTATPGDFFAGVRYAPDGNAVVLEWVRATPEDYEAVSEVTLARLDLANPTAPLLPLGDPSMGPETADWSPTGDLIVYAALPTAGAAGKDLHVIRPDGTGLRRLTTLTDGGGGAVHPDFADDGGTVLFVGSDEGGTRFMTVDVARGTTGPAFPSGALTGHHPRGQPTP